MRTVHLIPMFMKYVGRHLYSLQLLCDSLFPMFILQEDLSEKVVQGEIHPGIAGTACLLSSSFLEGGKDIGVVTLPIMSRNSRQTIGKVRGMV